MCVIPKVIDRKTSNLVSMTESAYRIDVWDQKLGVAVGNLKIFDEFFNIKTTI